MSKIKIILADDHPLIRAGFRTLLGKNEGFEITGEAGTGKELLELIKRTSLMWYWWTLQCLK